MAPIPAKLRRELAADPFMKVCIYNDEECWGRIEWEHAFMYAGKQVQEWWAIVPCCEYHHRYGGLKKEFNQLVGLLRAASLNLPAGDWLMVPDELYKKYPRTDWDLMLNTLIKKVGAPGAQKARSKVMRSYGGKTGVSR